MAFMQECYQDPQRSAELKKLRTYTTQGRVDFSQVGKTMGQWYRALPPGEVERLRVKQVVGKIGKSRRRAPVAQAVPKSRYNQFARPRTSNQTLTPMEKRLKAIFRDWSVQKKV